MKYCPNCGKPIKEEQTFYNNCGVKLNSNKQSSQKQYYEDSRNNLPPRQNSNYPYYNEEDKRGTGSVIWKVLLAIFIVLIVGLLFYGLYYAYNQFIANDNPNVTSQNSDSSSSSSELHGPHLDVFSDVFDKQYIKAPSKEGYAGIYKGMSKSEIENKYGKSDGSMFLEGSHYDKYGDIGVVYNENNEVINVVVAPSDVSETSYTDVYGQPDNRENDNLIYDAYKDNNFSVIVVVEDGMVKAIKNVNQLPSSD
ncbi:hypothetical protein ACUXJ9_001278 [Staphylococcus caledonicus]